MALTYVQSDRTGTGGGGYGGRGAYRGGGGNWAAAGKDDAISEVVSVKVSAAFMVTPS
jgi:hypothetical protein